MCSSNVRASVGLIKPGFSYQCYILLYITICSYLVWQQIYIKYRYYDVKLLDVYSTLPERQWAQGNTCSVLVTCKAVGCDWWFLL